MVEQCHQLRRVHGLSNAKNHNAVKWLREHHHMSATELTRRDPVPTRQQEVAVAVTPYLWGDLSILENASDTRQQGFHRLILEDYSYEQRRLS